MGPITGWLGVAYDLGNLTIATLAAAFMSALIISAWRLLNPWDQPLKTSEGRPTPRIRRGEGQPSNEFLESLIAVFIVAFFTSLVGAFVIAVSLGVVRIAENSFFSFPNGVEGGVSLGVALWLASLVTTLGSGFDPDEPLDKPLGYKLLLSLISYLVMGYVVGKLLDVAPLGR